MNSFFRINLPWKARRIVHDAIVISLKRIYSRKRTFHDEARMGIFYTYGYHVKQGRTSVNRGCPLLLWGQVRKSVQKLLPDGKNLTSPQDNAMASRCKLCNHKRKQMTSVLNRKKRNLQDWIGKKILQTKKYWVGNF